MLLYNVNVCVSVCACEIQLEIRGVEEEAQRKVKMLRSANILL